MATKLVLTGCKSKRVGLAPARTPGKVVVGYALVADDEWTHEVLENKSWHLGRNGYAMTAVVENGRTRQEYLHHLVYRHYFGDVPKGKWVDHENRDKLDCLPGNLRAVSPSVSQANKGRSRRNKSGCSGVSWYPKTSQWRARVTVNGKSISLGLHDNKDDAARAVNRAYERYFPGVAVPSPEVD